MEHYKTLTDEDILNECLINLRCWRFNITGKDFLKNDKNESEYMCCNCKFHDKCHSEELSPLEKKYNKLKGIVIETQQTL